MATYVCPKCGAVQNKSRMPPEYVWTLIYTFRCQNCATMLKLAGLRRRWVAFPAFAALVIALALTIDIPSPAFDPIFATIIASYVLLVVITACIPRDVVVHNEE